MENDNNDNSTRSVRRQPTPPEAGVAKAPGTVPPDSFYASASSSALKPPPLPLRPKNNLGSAHTKVSIDPPPTYDTVFREPQLVSEDTIGDDQVPALIPAEDNQRWQDAQPKWADDDGWNNKNDAWGEMPWDSAWAGGTTQNVVDSSGRDQEEETNWWDTELRIARGRPGPGMLPPLVAEMLHNPEHSLFSISVTMPDIKLPAAGDAPPSFIPPSHDEVLRAVPHANTYYCRRHHGWVFLLWKTSTILPPLAKSFDPKQHSPFPNQDRRKQTTSCDDNPFDKKTHHFHLYSKAVDSSQLNPAFHRAPWEVAAQRKQKRRKITSLNLDDLSSKDSDMMDEDPPEEYVDDGELLDLYVCCQCSVYCLASEVMPGVIALRYLEDFTKYRYDHPTVGKQPTESVVSGWETLNTIIENKLWKGENRQLPVSRKAFQNKIGWTPTIRVIFEQLGFMVLPTKSAVDESTSEEILIPPNTELGSPEGQEARVKLLRAWVETSAYLVDYQRRFATTLKNYTPHPSYVQIDSAREMYQQAIGAHPDQISRSSTPYPLGSLGDYTPLLQTWKILGITPTTCSPEILIFAYMAQCRCDPARTILYFTHFYAVVVAIQSLGGVPPQELQTVVFEERSRGRFTEEDVHSAAAVLGFGKDGALRLELEDDIEDDFLAEAWRTAIKCAWRDPNNSTQLQRDANDAFRIIAQSRGSKNLMKLWSESSKNQMDPSRAYAVLEVSADVDDELVLTVFTLRVEEQPHQSEKWREALRTIAEVRDSSRLRQFLEEGKDPGDIVVPTRADLPRGLNQLGNTCYLNSLLQYFYTIKDLREAIAGMANADVKALEDEKYSEDDLKRHRVGGRLITRREILRSKKFVSQLADLFWQLQYCENQAVTPTIDLAKLALVTSRDEEEDEADRGGTDSSNDTDATLVDDGSMRSSHDSNSSVLGKRPRDEQRTDMDVDPPTSPTTEEKNGYVMVSQPVSLRRSKSPRLSGESSSSIIVLPSKILDAEILHDENSQAGEQKKPPPLPTRKPTQSDSVMMFGKQHDVSECMDNCMFQIEIALLKFDGLNDSDSQNSVVKRLFYGKLRQRITRVPAQQRPGSSTHEKEDLFSHLPVNVADSGFDIYDGLSGYFDDVVEYEGEKARMEVALVDLPPLLQIQLQRVQFNRETLQPYKSQVYVKFGETIYMDRFLNTADPGKRARSKEIQANLNTQRERLRLLTQNKHAPFPASLKNTLDFLSKQETLIVPEIDDDLVANLNAEPEIIEAEITELKDTISKLKEELENVWKDDTSVAYELTSVFIHRGSSPSFGHYFFYSRHLPEEPDHWFKYNDHQVTEVLKSEVLADTTGSTANPYLLVFAKKDQDIVRTVNRFDPMSLDNDM